MLGVDCEWLSVVDQKLSFYEKLKEATFDPQEILTELGQVVIFHELI